MKNIDEINFQPLAIKSGTWRSVLGSYVHGWKLVVSVCIILLDVGLLFVPLGFLFSISIIVVWITYISYVANERKRAAWELFAVSNGWEFDTLTEIGSIIPTSIQFGYNPIFSSVIQAVIGTIAFDLVEYTTNVGLGNYRKTYSYTIGMLSFPRSMPHVLLLNKKTKIDVARDMSDGIPLKLEGDFDDYFSLEIERGQEVDVLQFITPDVMQKIIDYDQGLDIELIDQNIYFIAAHDQRDYSHLKTFIQSIVELSDQILRNS